MCTTKLFTCVSDRFCDHRWLEIDMPCGPGKGFDDCAIFKAEHKHLSMPPKRYKGNIDNCPYHGLKGNYDFNQIRMVDDIKYHIIKRPDVKSNKDHRAVKFIFCSVM